MASSASSPAEPDHTTPDEDDIVLMERSAPHHRLPNQHDLDADDDQVRWTEGAATWADFDDLDDALPPLAGGSNDDQPSVFGA